MDPFNFPLFASDIYREAAGLCSPPFMLPALYGGETADRYTALFVLEAPSVSFTEERWKPCSNVADAIRVHRSIFFAWASQRIPGKLFSALDRILSPQDVPADSSSEFFRRYYVTDTWKDAGQCTKRNNKKSYEAYWLSKLALELRNVVTERVIFVGREAESSGKALLRGGSPWHYVPFPRWSVSKVQIAAIAATLESEIANQPST
jgi:hypothetical protein